MNYTINQLRFYYGCKTKSITKTAQELHLTQPAVSIQLKNFQDQFDILWQGGRKSFTSLTLDWK